MTTKPLFSSRALFVATFFGTILTGAFLLQVNAWRSGHRAFEALWMTLVVFALQMVAWVAIVDAGGAVPIPVSIFLWFFWPLCIRLINDMLFGRALEVRLVHRLPGTVTGTVRAGWKIIGWILVWRLRLWRRKRGESPTSLPRPHSETR